MLLLCAALRQVLPLPDEYLLQHHVLYNEFHNASHWPKHVLVRYHFHTESDIDFDQGMYVIFGFGAWTGSTPGVLAAAPTGSSGTTAKCATCWRC